MSYLEKINTPSDLKNLSYAELEELAKEIRQTIIKTVSNNGGHLASNLGVVELTLALHRSFDLPRDSIVFDVGHQCYVHKLLTGRKEVFDTLRQRDGITGFTNRFESEYDIFGAGHSGTSVSAAMGIASGDRLNKNDTFSIAVVGDGSLTNGMIYEALNNCTEDGEGVIVVLNDNEMSISKNVGAMSKYLSEFSNSRNYIKFKNKVYAFCLKAKGFGKVFLSIGRFIKNTVKRLFMTKNYFECLGFKYFGPIDGHDQELLELVMAQAKRKRQPSVIHVITQKGKGYEDAENRADIYHSVGKFDCEKGVTVSAKNDFSSEFGKALCKLADDNEKIVAVTAAMGYGTGLDCFSKEHPDRFFDVGIAEEHALTFCGGLAARGMKSCFAVYSSFLQRCYDQLIHDIAIQKLPVVVAIDRAGLVPGDGITHQGIYDSSFLMSVPNFEVYTPESYADLRALLKRATDSENPAAIRYPRGCEIEYDRSDFTDTEDLSYADFGNGSNKVAVITYGRITYNVVEAAQSLDDSYSVRVIKLKKIKPMPFDEIETLCEGYEKMLVVEEGIKDGGVGEKVKCNFCGCEKTVDIIAVDGIRNFSGNIDDLYAEYGFTPKQIAEKIKNI